MKYIYIYKEHLVRGFATSRSTKYTVKLSIPNWQRPLIHKYIEYILHNNNMVISSFRKTIRDVISIISYIYLATWLWSFNNEYDAMRNKTTMIYGFTCFYGHLVYITEKYNVQCVWSCWVRCIGGGGMWIEIIYCIFANHYQYCLELKV